MDRDSDNDGINDGWESSHGLDYQNAGDGALDPDGDGQSNTAEYVAGTGLTSGGDFFKVQTTTMTTDSFSLTVNGVAGRSYRLQRRASLTTGTWITLTTQGPLASNALITLTDASPIAGQGFYRGTVNFP